MGASEGRRREFATGYRGGSQAQVQRERVASGRRMPVSQLVEKVALAGARVH